MQIRLEHLPADIHGMGPLERAALAGQLSSACVATRLADVSTPSDPYLPAERAHLSRWIETQVTPYGPHVAVLDSVRALSRPGAACVVSSADPRLLGGPLATLWQCLQSILMARQLEQQSGLPVVPVLVTQSDGRDSTQLESASIVNRNFELQAVRLEPVTRGARAIHEVPLSVERHGLGALRALLDQLYGDHEHIETALEMFLPREGENLSGAFTRTMYELLGRHGLIVLESHVLREESSHALAGVVGAGLLRQVRESMENLPNTESFALEEQELVHHFGAGGHRVLFAGGDGYRFSDEPGSRTRSELAAEIVQDPLAWWPGPLARGLVRDLVLPVAAAVGGSGELLRHILVAPLHASLERSTPAFAPRLSVSLVDGDAQAALQRLGISLAGAIRGEIRSPEPQQGAGGPLIEELEGIAAGARQQLARLKPRVVELDPALKTPLRSCSRDLQALIRKLGQTIDRVQSNQAGKRNRRRRCLRNGLLPDDRPQDRVLGPFGWVASQGTDWISEVLEDLDPLASAHVAILLG